MGELEIGGQSGARGWGLGVVGCKGQSGSGDVCGQSGDTWGPDWGMGEVHGAKVGGRGMQCQSGVLGCGGARVRCGYMGSDGELEIGGQSRGRGWGCTGDQSVEVGGTWRPDWGARGHIGPEWG